MVEEDLTVSRGRVGSSPVLKIIFSLALIMIVLTAAYFYFFYPTAVIEIEPHVSEVRAGLTLYGSAEINSTDRKKGTIPLREMEVEISAEQEISTSGERLVGDTAARGSVKFINEAKKPVTIPAGTILESSGGMRFKTLSPVEVPGLEIDYLMDLPVGMRAGQAEGEVVCLEKGSRGNVSIGSINKMIGGPEDIYLLNVEPTQGGSDKRYRVISETDREELGKRLENYLRDKLITRFYQESGGNYRIIEEELKFSRPEISYSGEVGDTADNLKASGTLTARGYVLKNSELNYLVNELFQEKLAGEKRLLISDIDIKGVELEKAAEVKAGAGLDENTGRLYNIKVELLAPVITDFNFEQLAAGLRGSGVEEARKLLEERKDIKSVAINTDSSNLPGLGFAIKMVVREPELKKVYTPGD